MVLGNGKIMFGTMCSGMEVVCWALLAIQTSLRTVLQLEANFIHTFAVELHPGKRDFIKNYYKPGAIYGNVLGMAQDELLDWRSGTVKHVPRVQVLVAGFECDSVSAQNNTRGEFQDCVARGVGSTGTTFKGILLYIHKHKPIVVILENVPALTHNCDPDALVLELQQHLDKHGQAKRRKLSTNSSTNLAAVVPYESITEIVSPPPSSPESIKTETTTAHVV